MGKGEMYYISDQMNVYMHLSALCQAANDDSSSGVSQKAFFNKVTNALLSIQHWSEVQGRQDIAAFITRLRPLYILMDMHNAAISHDIRNTTLKAKDWICRELSLCVEPAGCGPSGASINAEEIFVNLKSHILKSPGLATLRPAHKTFFSNLS